MSVPQPPVDYASPVGSGRTPDLQGDATGWVIPYKNVPALVGYYLGIVAVLFALLGGVLGVAAGIAALVLGVLGLRKKKREPHVKGTAHAIIAIIGGAIGILLGGAVTALLIVAIVNA